MQGHSRHVLHGPMEDASSQTTKSWGRLYTQLCCLWHVHATHTVVPVPYGAQNHSPGKTATEGLRAIRTMARTVYGQGQELACCKDPSLNIQHRMNKVAQKGPQSMTNIATP